MSPISVHPAKAGMPPVWRATLDPLLGPEGLRNLSTPAPAAPPAYCRPGLRTAPNTQIILHGRAFQRLTTRSITWLDQLAPELRSHQTYARPHDRAFASAAASRSSRTTNSRVCFREILHQAMRHSVNRFDPATERSAGQPLERRVQALVRCTFSGNQSRWLTHSRLGQEQADDNAAPSSLS